ncbi:hypothetical protein PoB_007473600 [Plakobranchus ocellatus]|uniref:Uncharacterized protein n=1 Tax=Plakobranchus ocellatus TaxID=259542 RepID=A0AAV4DVT0_9GAST|nr:hypothetical protein PoB_007473600 [Plakobranchus ocellatus]
MSVTIAVAHVHRCLLSTWENYFTGCGGGGNMKPGSPQQSSNVTRASFHPAWLCIVTDCYAQKGGSSDLSQKRTIEEKGQKASGEKEMPGQVGAALSPLSIP